jgi:uroporphyrinogen-III synthase
MVDALALHYSRERTAELLGSVTVLARGPKPVAALRELGLQPACTAPEPNTWKEVLAVLDSNVQLKRKRVAVQEYGITNQELLAGLEARGAAIFRVPVYRWALPEDIAPLQAAIRDLVAQRRCCRLHQRDPGGNVFKLRTKMESATIAKCSSAF